MVKRRSYTARYERDENGYWSVVVKVAPKQVAISDGQTLPKARRKILQAVSLLLDAPEDSFELVDDVRLGPSVTKALRSLHVSRERLAKEARHAEEAQRKAAEALVAAGISRRDAGEVLGVSGQRVQQLLRRSKTG